MKEHALHCHEQGQPLPPPLSTYNQKDSWEVQILPFKCKYLHHHVFPDGHQSKYYCINNRGSN